MRICVALRGGVGDFFVWAALFPAIFEFHGPEAKIDLFLCSTWPEALTAWANSFKACKWGQVLKAVEYNRPISTSDMERCCLGYDLVYHFDVWKGQRGQPTEDVPFISPFGAYPWLEADPYPETKIKGDGVGGTVIQVNGRSVGDVCTPEWWRRGLAGFPKPIRLLGELSEPYTPKEYGAEACLTDPIAIYAAILDAKMMVGIDSGFRNIAFTTQTPVVEIRKRGLGSPDYDVFVPEVYRGRMRFLDLDPPTLDTVDLKEILT